MAWKDRLVEASFRGVPFKVEEESAGTGRRVETHEYPNRDKPYTEDLGKITFRPSITAYVVGDDCFDQRDRLIDALNKPGPGTLVHPTYGELKVCVDGEVRVWGDTVVECVLNKLCPSHTYVIFKYPE